MSSSNTVVQLKKLLAVVPDIIKEVGYSELYGFDLNTLADTPEGTVIRDRLLTKFLVANKFVIDASASQLKKTLAWRKSFNPLSAAFLETHNDVFEKLGVITSVPTPKVPEKPKAAAVAPKAVAPTTKKEAIETNESDATEAKESETVEAKEAAEAKEDAEAEAAAEASEAKEAAEAKEDAEAAATAEVAETKAEHEVAKETVDEVAEVTEAPEATEGEPEETAEAVEEVVPVKETNLIYGWNLYGAVKNRSALFSNLPAFLRWRVGEMERAISLLDFSNFETSYIAQVHDYNNVSFLFLDSNTKAGSKATIELFQSYYPEFLNVKYFVNVPTVMSWLFSFSKLFVSKETVDKFRVISSGAELAKTAGPWVPKQYGGRADSLSEISVKEFSPVNPELVHKYEPETKKEAAAPEATATGPAAPQPGAVPEAPGAEVTKTVDVAPATEEADGVDGEAVTDAAAATETTTAAKEAEPKTEAAPEVEGVAEVEAATTAEAETATATATEAAAPATATATATTTA